MSRCCITLAVLIHFLSFARLLWYHGHRFDLFVNLLIAFPLHLLFGSLLCFGYLSTLFQLLGAGPSGE
jgi:hypothetical protein